jgi:hypothetical protein
MLTKFLKLTVCSIGAMVLGKSAIAGNEQDRDDQRLTYVVYEVPQERPHNVCSSTPAYYSRTVEYRCVTEYYRTTECDIVERSCPAERAMRSIRYAYLDP